ncbi:MAG: ATP-binding protein [Blastocatellia bacterium]
METQFEAQRRRLEEQERELAALRLELAAQAAKNAALHESEGRFRTIIETANEGVWLLDRSARTIYVNERMAELLGYPEEEVLGRAITDFCFAEDAPLAVARVEGNLRGRYEKYDFRFRRADGGELHVLAATNPIRDASREITGTLGMFTDITDRKRAEVEREKLLARAQNSREQAEAASRSKDEFIALISHELRAPLNAMLGWACVLKDGGADAATHEHAVEIIERSARTQQKLIEDLLDTSRIISGNMRLETGPVDLAQVVRTAANTMRPAAEAKEIELELKLRGGGNIITGDPDRLQQVLWNLLSNAVKFTPGGGRVTVRLERADPYIRLTIADTGIGISPDFLPYVFHRFYQANSSTTRRQGGLGLGLSLVRNLVELHGGSVEAESAGEGQGATFRVNLPVRALRRQKMDFEGAAQGDKETRRRGDKETRRRGDKETRRRGDKETRRRGDEETRRRGDKETRRRGDSGGEFPLSPAPPVPLSSRPLILDGLWALVVDDEADARDLVATLLKQCGARVTAAASAAEAFALLREGEAGARPDVLVSDIGMPDEDGYQLLRRVRALARDEGGSIPAVALTAYGRARDRIKALSAGFQTHIPKPVEPEELMMVIAGLTGHAMKEEL